MRSNNLIRAVAWQQEWQLCLPRPCNPRSCAIDCNRDERIKGFARYLPPNVFSTKFAPQSFDYILGTMLITDLLLWIKRKHKSGFNSNHYNMDKFLKQLILTWCQIPDHHFTKHQTKTQTQSLQPLIKILAVVKRYLLTVRSTS